MLVAIYKRVVQLHHEKSQLKPSTTALEFDGTNQQAH
jgi:hypothetical protein